MKQLKDILKRYQVVAFLKRYNELWLAPIAVVLFLVAETVIPDLDPRAVPYTIDVFQKVFFGLAAFAMATFCSMIAIRLAWPSIFTFLIDQVTDHFNQLTPWEKLKLCFSVFALYVLGLLLAMLIP
jgi:hypothetical protein